MVTYKERLPTTIQVHGKRTSLCSDIFVGNFYNFIGSFITLTLAPPHEGSIIALYSIVRSIK